MNRYAPSAQHRKAAPKSITQGQSGPRTARAIASNCEGECTGTGVLLELRRRQATHEYVMPIPSTPAARP
eukprot:606644-Pyramimonas_sp.AAC.1